MNEQGRKTEIQIIGNSLEALERPLRQKGIYIDSIIGYCSPFAMSGKKLSVYDKYCDEINQMPILLNIRKNLSQMLSDNADEYCSNYISPPVLQEVKYRNTTEYVIVMNTMCSYTLYEKEGTVYSDTFSENPFINDIRKDKDFCTQVFPFYEGFNWKYYYSEFVEAIKSRYDSEHIILIKVNAAQWMMNGQNIEFSDKKSMSYRNRIMQMDEFFVEQTHCLVIDEQFSRIPPKKIPCAVPYAQMSAFTYRQLQYHIERIVDGEIEAYRPYVNKYLTPIARYLGYSLSAEYRESKLLKKIDSDWMQWPDIAKKADENKIGFWADINGLKPFIEQNGSYRLSDYVFRVLHQDEKTDKQSQLWDFEMIQNYTKYFKLDINDILAVYAIYKECDNKTDCLGIIRNILNNLDCVPIQAAKQFRTRNSNYLINYPYISTLLLENYETDDVYIRIENNVFLQISEKNNEIMREINLSNSEQFDYYKIFENDYECPISRAEELCSNLSFYLERAKRGEGARPIKIVFDSISEFSKYLWFIDFEDILESENFILSLRGEHPEYKDYRPVCDLSFLCRDNIKIRYLGNGFNDQLRFYIFGQKMEEISGGTVFYDDIYSFYYGNHYGGNQVKKVTTKSIEEKLLSNLFSTKLLEFFCEKFKTLKLGVQGVPVILHDNGLNDMVVCALENRAKNYLPMIIMSHPSVQCDLNLLRDFNRRGITYYDVHANPEELLNLKTDKVSDYVSFPQFTDRMNMKIEQAMLSSDAVVIHVRRGDYIASIMGNDKVNDASFADYSFFSEAIKKLLKIDDYPNKKYFVFSDDIPWCKENVSKLGLTLVDEKDIYYIDHNKGVDSYRDMQLMMKGKIMLISHSGFARTAVLLSDRCEVMTSMRGRTKQAFIKAGRDYKYNIDPPDTLRGRFKNWL